ncbi:lipoprotein [Pseudomonas sp. 21]|nr:lipoprotein [Pseudomonas sp. 21]MBV7586040.1 sel1 repeat family protein [Pseudomonas sp. PDM33]
MLVGWVLLSACDSGSALPPPKAAVAVDPLPQIRANLAFTCKHEEFPTPTADSDTLFHYARWLQKNNQLKEAPGVDVQIERLYRIAAEQGHAKANINLQNGSMQGTFKIRTAEHLRLTEELINAKVAAGYAFIAIALQQGALGLVQDKDMALRYYRKAADMGSPEAQTYVADKLAPSDMAPDIARQMRRCAAEQGNGDAASDLGVNLKNNKRYREALEAFQLGVAAGDENSASFLSNGFRNPPASNRLYYLDQQEDLDRADRYKKICNILADYSYASPKVPEINDILPLPPAKLPPWDGKLQWLEERKANIPPPKPSEALIQQLAKDKHLDPATGRPLPESPNFMRQASDLTCESDQACPLAGYWVAQSYWSQEVRYYKQGDILPRCRGKDFVPRIWPLPDKMVDREWIIKWGYVGEA